MYRTIRGIKFLAKEYPPTHGFKRYSAELEQAIADSIHRIPPSPRLFQKPDGTLRNPDDNELKVAANLGSLHNHKRATLFDKFKMTSEQATLFEENSALLEPYYLESRRVLDKIPVLDPNTGEVTWSVVYENQKESWENIMYYMYVPGLLGALGLYFFLQKENLDDWALEELKLRAQERFGENENDDLVVERILSGDYDRLGGLKRNDLPAKLL